MKRIFLICSLIAAITFISCGGEEKQQGFLDPSGSNISVISGQASGANDPSLNWNGDNVQREMEDIYFFLQRYHWNAQQLGSGVFVEILENGSGPQIQSGDEVSLEYVTQALTGDTVYTSQTSGLKTFKVDKSEEISGLHEAVKGLQKGTRAHIVVPSWRAYGVGGDGDRIRGKMSLAMTVKIADIKPNKAE